MSLYSAVPQPLKDFPHWVVWKLEQRGGRDTKVPYDAKSNGKSHYAKSNDPTTWTDFNQAEKVATDIFNNKYDGIGFMLQGTSLVGIDFDGVLHDGVAGPFVLAILERLSNPYTEITPSGNGLRAFVECPALPAGQRKFSSNKYGAEIYSGSEGGRYLTVTGNHFSGDGIPKIDDIGLAYFLVSQIRNVKFKNLWVGDISEYGGDQSRADLALLDILARHLHKDAAKMEQYFTASKLGQREKWTQRADYRARTIAKALGVKDASSNQDERFDERPDGDDGEPFVVEVISRTGSSIKPKRLKWFWEKRIPLGKITLFAGNPDNGKSLAANSLAAICTTGQPFPDLPNMIPPSDVLMMLGEDDLEDTAIPRLMAAGADLSKIHFIEGVMRGNQPGDTKLDVDMPVLEKKLQEFPNARLLVIDPISNFLGGTSMFGEQDVRAEILVPLKNLAAKYNIAVVIVMHLNKKAELDAISRVGGAMAFIGIARCSWMFVRDLPTEDGETPDSFSMSRIKNNLTAASHGGLAYKIEFNERVFHDEDGAVGAPYVVWGSVVQKSADQALGTGRREVGRPKGSDSKVQDAIAFLENALANGPKPGTELFEKAYHLHGVKKRTLERAKDELKLHAFKEGKTWFWKLSPMNATKETVSAAENTEPVMTLMDVS